MHAQTTVFNPGSFKTPELPSRFWGLDLEPQEELAAAFEGLFLRESLRHGLAFAEVGWFALHFISFFRYLSSSKTRKGKGKGKWFLFPNQSINQSSVTLLCIGLVSSALAVSTLILSEAAKDTETGSENATSGGIACFVCSCLHTCMIGFWICMEWKALSSFVVSSCGKESLTCNGRILIIN